ncbi:GDSL family lipase [Cohnella sp. CIP 111063]|uniref:rhamnogalacturonan acetylesterase n=1 Tax=unclassified Cohnella TaxID=2636738 RepID=UPI000B8C4BF5|nr:MULTISPECIES: rhamnogalacturonan acetylesterase [unclassified Cohnella]OXS61744.1 GDSL family lipase [Cohnella sp. CIP 111063]PRX74179.1 lysophospholipase L1-like esterase [Cohnella sp. SGD-V74]
MACTGWKFDFGVGEAESGWIKTTEDCRYTEERGYGFAGDGAVTARDRGEPGRPWRDLIIPAEAAFRVDLPDGNYTVTLGMGDWTLPACTTLKAAPGRLLLLRRRVPSGQFARETVGVRVRGGRLELKFSGPAPRINWLEIAAAPDAIALHLVGDSTVADQPDDGYPYAGWGQMLPHLLKHDVIVVNHAASGRSSRSFIGEGRWDEALRQIKPGDYVFVQFGHNDQKTDEARHTDPDTTYVQFLGKYIEDALEKGARPVLVTSAQRRYFEEDGTLRDTHGRYPEAVRKLAEERGVPLIDLAGKTKRLLEELGPEASSALFMHGAPGEFANFAGGIEDNTHFQEQGAIRMAELIAEGIREAGLWPLTMYLR